MPDHHLEREEHAGDGGGHAAAQQGVRKRPAELEFLGDEGAHGGAEMDHRTFPTGRGTGAQRDGAGKRGHQPRTQIDAPLPQGRCLDDFGDAVQMASREQEVH